MILALDSHYAEDIVRTAGVLFSEWIDAEPAATQVLEQAGAAASYEPGAFYRRELPHILALLESLPAKADIIVVDGYVFLDDQGRKGLGAHLYDALDGKTPVIGVAKRPFAGSPHAEAIYRGDSKRPLFVTAAGLPLKKAADFIGGMHGSHRLPTLLKLADRLCRDG